jgi:hypothetical protein
LRSLLVLAVFALASAPATAGPNANGAILVHTNDSYDYLSATACTTSLGLPSGCASATTRTDRPAGTVVWFLAYFLPTANPVVSAVYFGIDFDENSLGPITEFSACGPAGGLEISDAGWPANGAGNTIGFGTPIRGETLFAFYSFRVDDRSGGPPSSPYLCSAINPSGRYAAFIDDRFPPARDDIFLFGCVKWYGNGHNDCPGIVLPRGACCLIAGECLFIEQIPCEQHAGQISWTVNTPCAPQNPCPQPRACCDLETGACEVVLWDVCLPPRVVYWTDCAPSNPCPPKGACCEPETGNCTYVLEWECTNSVFWHPDWNCDVDVCPRQPMGACCAPNGDCAYVALEDCRRPHVWHHEWFCNPNPCPAPVEPTEETTWGRIKAIYR